MTDYIVNHRREISPEMLPEMLRVDGKPTLEIKLHYFKDARRRGLKLSVYRCAESDFGTSYDIMNKQNGCIHLADMQRKPSAKVAAAWAAAVNARLDDIARVALASDAPDWLEVEDMFSHNVA